MCIFSKALDSSQAHKPKGKSLTTIGMMKDKIHTYTREQQTKQNPTPNPQKTTRKEIFIGTLA